jgi:hypothetical protein
MYTKVLLLLDPDKTNRIKQNSTHDFCPPELFSAMIIAVCTMIQLFSPQTKSGNDADEIYGRSAK